MTSRNGGKPGPAANEPIPIDALLASLGYRTTAARAAARAVLESAGLTRTGKQSIAPYKRDAAVRALSQALVRVCGYGCAELSRQSDRRRRPVRAAATTCEICGGSNNRRAALAAARALADNHVREVLVVGGSPAQQNDLRAHFEGTPVHLEFVDGTRTSHSQKDAIANMNRAQLVVIWAPTQLRHAVSNHYTEETPKHVRRISIPRRGIESLCQEIVTTYARKRA